MADAPEIKVKLTAEDTGVAAAIKELGAQLKNLKKQQDSTAESSLSLKKAFDGLLAIGIAVKIEEFGRAAFNAAINVGKMSDKTGISTQTLSVFHNVADDVGASVDGVDKGILKAATTITQFEQGSVKAAKGFQLLNITQKDFKGLNPDEKILLVTNRLGGMAAGFQKATAQALIFGKGASDVNLFANALAAQGMEAATESTRKLGLLLDQTTTDDFRAAKAAMQELEDAGQGMATQFEAGMLPAITDVGEALVDALTQGGVSFKDVGRVAGNVVKGIALVFIGLAQTLGTVADSIYDIFSKVWEEIRNNATTQFTALSQVLHGHFSDAEKTLEIGANRSVENVKDAVERQRAIYTELGKSFAQDVNNLFPSADEEERRRKERLAKLRPDKQTEAPEVKSAAAPTDAAARAELALLNKQLQDELELHRAYAKQTEQVDKEMYDTGEISLAEYFDRRKTAIIADTEEEVAILQRGLAAAQADVVKAENAKKNAATPKDQDKQEAARLNALAKVDELQTRISVTQISSDTKISALKGETHKTELANNEKIYDLHKQIAISQGKDLEVAKQEIAIERQKLEIILKQSGLSAEQTEAELKKYTDLKTAQATFDQTQKQSSAALKSLENDKSAIQDKVTAGRLYQVQADEQIRDLELQRLPALQAIADQLVAQAKLTGDIQKIQAAEDFQKSINSIGAATNVVGQQVAQLKTTVQGSLTSGFSNLFTGIVSGAQSVGGAFKNLAASVVQSLSQVAAQMLATLLVKKLLGGASGGGGFFSNLLGFSGGGDVQAKAGGGLIRGPGGPKDDKVPAMLSHGEYVVQADAVSKFGIQNLEAINRGMQIPSLSRLALPKFAEGGLVGDYSHSGSESSIKLGIGLDEGLILKHLQSKGAGQVILQHLTENPKAAQKALSRSD